MRLHAVLITLHFAICTNTQQTKAASNSSRKNVIVSHSVERAAKKVCTFVQRIMFMFYRSKASWKHTETLSQVRYEIQWLSQGIDIANQSINRPKFYAIAIYQCAVTLMVTVVTDALRLFQLLLQLIFVSSFGQLKSILVFISWMLLHN